MAEGQSFPLDFSPDVEGQPEPNPFYHAIAKNHQRWREAKHDILHPHEMPRVSEKIEQNMKRIFAGYLDLRYPRVLVARTVLQTDYLPTESPFYNYGWNYRYPETVTSEDHLSYAQGILALNEWATNYATRYYLEQTSKTPLTKPLRKLYGQAADAVSGKSIYASIYKSMGEVKKTTQASGDTFNHAVFQALFQHDFIALNELIAHTPTLDATNLDELAVLLGTKAQASQNIENVVPANFTHAIEVSANNVITSLYQLPTDSSVKRFGKAAGWSLLAAGNFSTPGVVEIGIGGQVGGAAAGSLVGGLEEVLTRGDIKQGLIIGGSLMAATAVILPYVTIHESVHGYSAGDNYVGLIPQQLYSPGKKTK